MDSLEVLTKRRLVENMFKDSLNLQKSIEMAFLMESRRLGIPPMPPREDELKPHDCLVSMANINLSCSNHSAGERMNMGNAAAMMHAIRDGYIKAGVS